MATTSMSVFQNLDCLSLVVCSNTTLLKLQTAFFFFKILRVEIGGAAYPRTFTVIVDESFYGTLLTISYCLL